MKLFLQLLSCNRIGHAEWVFSLHLPWSTIISEVAETTSIVVWEIPPALKSTCSLELSDWIFKDGSFYWKYLLVVLAWTIHDGIPPRRYLLLSSECPFSADLIMFQVDVHHINAVTTLLTFIFRKQTDHLLIEASQIILFPAIHKGAHLLPVLFFASSSDGQCKKPDQKQVPLHNSEQPNSSTLATSYASFPPKKLFGFPKAKGSTRLIVLLC